MITTGMEMPPLDASLVNIPNLPLLLSLLQFSKLFHFLSLLHLVCLGLPNLNQYLTSVFKLSKSSTGGERAEILVEGFF